MWENEMVLIIIMVIRRDGAGDARVWPVLAGIGGGEVQQTTSTAQLEKRVPIPFIECGYGMRLQI